MQNFETGQIVAMASYPTFDNRWFTVGLSKAKFKQLFPEPDKADPNRADKSILVNRAIQGQYNLGSTFKPFVAYAGMMAGVRAPDEIFEDTGSWKLDIDKAKCNEGVRCEYFNALGPFGKPSVYGPVKVEDALAVSSDAFFYSIGELMYKKSKTLLGDEVRQFGFGAKSGIDLPFEFTGRIPTAELKASLIDKGVLRKNESRNMLVGDNVQLAIGQGLLAASPLQLANGYSTIADGGFLHRPHIIRAIYQGGVPGGAPGYGDFTTATLIQSFDQPEVIQQIDFPEDVKNAIMNGLTRVITGPGVDFPASVHHYPTAELLFRNYPDDALPLAGKTGTAQGADSKPWYDSSVFAAFSRDPSQPYTIVSYLEKAGYGAKASAPLVKCIANALGGQPGGVVMDQPTLSDPLDQTSVVPAPDNVLPDMSCAINQFDTGPASRD